MNGNATMEFEPDYYEFHIKISVTSGTSGNAVLKGRSCTEEILHLLQDKLGFDIKTFTLKDEETQAMYNRKDGYRFEKEFYFQYEPDNGITESITSLLENMSDIEYEIQFRLNNKPEKEQQVLSLAVNNAREKAEKLASSLGSHINGFKEIRYEFEDQFNSEDRYFGCIACADRSVPESLASDLKNPKIEISKTIEIIWLTD